MKTFPDFDENIKFYGVAQYDDNVIKIIQFSSNFEELKPSSYDFIVCTDVTCPNTWCDENLYYYASMWHPYDGSFYYYDEEADDRDEPCEFNVIYEKGKFIKAEEI